ncbi:MAG: hypothetical protein ACR2KX_03015 [Chitinophagaceae bacterium]|jgi:hypothetical protein
MTATQSLKLYQIAQRYFNNPEDASAFISEIEMVVDNKLDARRDILATKEDIYQLKIEMKEQKSELIKWMFIFWIGQLGATIAIILLFIKR